MPGTPNTRLQVLVQEAGWSPAQLARSLRAVAINQGLSVKYSAPTVRRWLEGRRPRPPAPALLLECLSRRLGRPITPQEAGLTDIPAPVVNPSWEADPVHKLNQLLHAELDPDRPSPFDARHFSVAALMLPREFTFGSPMSPAAEASPAQSIEGDRLRGMSNLFHSAVEAYGGEHVRAALTAYLARHVMPLLPPHVYSPTHRDVLSAAAQLTLLLATMCADSGYQRTAQHYHQIAARLAADTGDQATLAIVLRAMATHAYNLGHYGPAVLNLAEHAAVRARTASPAVQAYTQAHLAVLQAHHDRHAALAALDRAQSLHSRVDAAPGPFTTYPAGALHFQRARALNALGDAAGAIRALTISLRLRTTDEHRAAALTRAHLAETHLRVGHLDEALNHWHVFVTAYPTLNSSRAASHLQRLGQQLLPYQRHPQVVALLAQVRLIIRHPD
ncbi:tetratricopeptide (TPR) repeat protein [Streptomyces sp. V4I8]|uniref:hypothetical protein n=1 Tax=Streptomyces sp. V4I8 TaxID=3156469 RepID=UPI0035149CD4